MQDGGVIGSAPAVAPSAAPSRRVELEEWDYRANASPVNGYTIGGRNGQYSIQTQAGPVQLQLHSGGGQMSANLWGQVRHASR